MAAGVPCKVRALVWVNSTRSPVGPAPALFSPKSRVLMPGRNVTLLLAIVNDVQPPNPVLRGTFTVVPFTATLVPLLSVDQRPTISTVLVSRFARLNVVRYR